MTEVLFGLGPLLVSLVIFVLTYAVIVTERINRAIVALLGASANLVVAGFAERAGQPIRFLPFMLGAFPLMLLSIAISHFYIGWRYLP
ncbi:MAG: hypothetical protein Q8Q28_10640 [Pseudomonadota bacterium]|nr:hypothetical protein [Pseudomonadota bacterium]